MNKDIAVIVQETPVHIVEVRTGVMGKRGPKGDTGIRGIQGLTGPQGERGRDIVVVPVTGEVINVTPDNHGDFYLSLNSEALAVSIVLGSTTVTNIDDELVDYSGAAAFFVQTTDVPLEVRGLDETITVIPPKDKNPKAYGIGCTFGVVSKGNNTWVLFGDLETSDTIVP